MFYTVGDKESYDLGLKNVKEHGSAFAKLGRMDDYVGGIAFRCLADAYLCSLETGYEIYVLDTDESNTYFHSGKRHIINSCNILKGPTLLEKFDISPDTSHINEVRVYDCGEYKEIIVIRRPVPQYAQIIDTVNWKFWDDKLLNYKIECLKAGFVKGLKK